MYLIRRFYRDSNHENHRAVIKKGLTLEEAQEHCQDDSTHEPGVWFDGYEEMNRAHKKPGLLEQACQILYRESRGI